MIPLAPRRSEALSDAARCVQTIEHYSVRSDFGRMREGILLKKTWLYQVFPLIQMDKGSSEDIEWS